MNPTDPTSTDPTSTDPTSTDPTSTDPTSTGGRVTVAEIAEFLRHLRALSTSLAVDPAHDTSAGRATFAAHKADLFARIAAQHPDLTPPTTAPPTTRPDGGRA